MNPKRTKTIIQSTFLAFLMMTVVFASSPIWVLAQVTNANTPPPSQKAVGTDPNTGKPIYQGNAVNQASAYRNGIQNGESSGQASNAANAVGSAIGCSAGQILANMVTSAISSGISKIQGSGEDQIVNQTAVPSNQVSQGQFFNQSAANTSAHTGQLAFGGILSGASWDSVAWCVVNAIIEYIADATIQWANSGFNGNPAFVDNPGKFFTDLADQQAAQFIQGVAKNEFGINVCQPFRVQVAIDLANGYANGGGEAGQSCTLSTIANNYNSFVNGNFNQGGWPGWLELTQNPNNNIYGARIINTKRMYAAIANQNNTATLELGWNKGFLSFQHCDTPGDKDTCHTTTPGTLIQSSLEKSLNLPKDRLVLAQKFDQVVTVIINNLIKVALNEVLTTNKDQNK